MGKNSLLDRVSAIKNAKPVELDSEKLKSTPEKGTREARRFERTVSFKFGSIKFRDGRSIECVVLDYNSYGVKVAIKGEYNLPQRMHISIPELGASHMAELAWQNGDRAGLKYELAEE